MKHKAQPQTSCLRATFKSTELHSPCTQEQQRIRNKFTAVLFRQTNGEACLPSEPSDNAVLPPCSTRSLGQDFQGKQGLNGEHANKSNRATFRPKSCFSFSQQRYEFLPSAPGRKEGRGMSFPAPSGSSNLTAGVTTPSDPLPRSQNGFSAAEQEVHNMSDDAPRAARCAGSSVRALEG